MNIGIDIDDTINDLASILIKYARKYNTINGIKFDINENEWDFDKAFGWNEQEAMEFMNTYISQVFDESKPKENAVKIISKLKNDGHKIIIITARHSNHVKNVYHISRDWLKKYNVPYNKLIINSDNKAEKCEENNVDIFIDDSIKHCENVQKRLEIPVYLFDSVYNKKYENTHIKRVFSWKEIYDEINYINSI